MFLIMARTKQTARKMPQEYPRTVFAPSTSGASTSRASDPPQETGESRFKGYRRRKRHLDIFTVLNSNLVLLL